MRRYLSDFVSRPATGAEPDPQCEETPDERRRRLLKEAIDDITANGGGLIMSENLPRDDLYDRDALSADEARALRGTGWEGDLDELRSGR